MELQSKSPLYARLLQNGQQITSIDSHTKILVPQCTQAIDTFEALLFLLMGKETFKKALHNWAYKEGSDDLPEAVTAYLNLLRRFDKATADRLDSEPTYRIGRYNSTFEWYIKELMLKKFGAKTAEFGVTLEDMGQHEFDCIADTDNGLVFVECKAGKNETIFDADNMKKFVDRDKFLNASYSFFLFDRSNLFGDRDISKIKIREAQSAGVFRVSKVTSRNEKHTNVTFYHVDTIHGQTWFLAASAFENLEITMRYMFMYTYLQSTSTWIHYFNKEEIAWEDRPQATSAIT